MTPDELVTMLRGAGCVFAEEEARLILDASAGSSAQLDRLAARRCAGEPLELVLGWAELAGARVAIRAGVFVPRRRSERLVAHAASLLGQVRGRRPVVVDLGCGSGALLVAVLRSVRCIAYAIDSSVVAVECATENLAGTGAEVLLGAGLSPLPGAARGRVDVIMANLPYVPTDAIALLPREARLFEPQSTLDGGADGLAPFASAIAEASAWLRPGGHYLGELHQSQVEPATLVAERHGFRCLATTDPEDGTAVVDLAAPR